MQHETAFEPRSPLLLYHAAKLALVLSVTLLANVGLGAETSAGAAKWDLVWSDDFDYQGLPDPKKWDYEEGFVRNQEPQYYTRARQENARVENGMLIIEARKEKYKNPRYDSSASNQNGASVQKEFAEYSSASLVTWKKANWQYGRFEIRAKLPMSPGMWPAFWTLGTSRSEVGWPACGEIDIMECWGHTPRSVTSCVHFQKDGRHQSDFGKTESKESLEDFHVYAMEWYPDRIDFFFDGQKYHSVPLSKLEDKGDDAFRKPHHILLNLAVEGHGRKVEEQALPQRLVVDYVRVYQLAKQ